MLLFNHDFCSYLADLVYTKELGSCQKRASGRCAQLFNCGLTTGGTLTAKARSSVAWWVLVPYQIYVYLAFQ